jgi:hypothetical protein
VNTAFRFSNRLKSANHRPKVENRSALDFVDAIRNHYSGKMR